MRWFNQNLYACIKYAINKNVKKIFGSVQPENDRAVSTYKMVPK